MQEIVRGLGPAAGLFVGAPETSGLDCQVQSFRHSRVVGHTVGKLNYFTGDVIRGGA